MQSEQMQSSSSSKSDEEINTETLKELRMSKTESIMKRSKKMGAKRVIKITQSIIENMIPS